MLAKYCRQIISKVNIFCFLFNEAVQHSLALISTSTHVRSGNRLFDVIEVLNSRTMLTLFPKAGGRICPPKPIWVFKLLFPRNFFFIVI